MVGSVHPGIYASLCTSGYTTVRMLHADHAGLLTTVGVRDSLGSAWEKPVGREPLRVLKSLIL